MTKTNHQFICILLCILLIITGIQIAAAKTTTENAFTLYSWDEETKTLTMSGMDGSIEPSEIYPWYSYAQEAKVIVIDDTCKEIPPYAFNGIYKLGGGIQQQDENATPADAAIVIQESPELKVIIGSSIEKIGEYAFAWSPMTELEFEQSTAPLYIADNAFYGCGNLLSLNLAPRSGLVEGTALSNVTLGEYVFSLCTMLQDVCFPSVEKEITYRMESDDDTVEDRTVRIAGHSIINLPRGTFMNCPNLYSFYFDGADELSTNTIFTYVETIGDRAFYGTGITYIWGIQPPDAGNWAFADTSSITTIGEEAFCRSALQSVYLAGANRLQTFGINCFAGCENLMYVEVPDGKAQPIIKNITTIGDAEQEEQTAGVENPEVITETTGKNKEETTAETGAIDDTKEALRMEDTVVQEGTEQAAAQIVEEGTDGDEDSFELPILPDDNVTWREASKTIPRGMFAGCSNLTSVVNVPDGAIIGETSFSGCIMLNKIAKSNENSNEYDMLLAGLSNAAIIRKYAFEGCTSIGRASDGDNIITVALNAKRIEEGAFKGCTGIQQVMLGCTVQELGLKAFYKCSNLNAVFVQNEKMKIGSETWHKYAEEGGSLGGDVLDETSEPEKNQQILEEKRKITIVTPYFSTADYYAKRYSDYYEIDYGNYIKAASEFDDVSPNKWYAKYVEKANEEGWLLGTSPTMFNPDGNMTRAMFATVLWRMENCPAVKSWTTFEDIAEGKYYTEAVRWASNVGIVDGVTKTKFKPQENITREQFVTMLYRYAKWKWKIDETNFSIFELQRYLDHNKISKFAQDAMSWAVQTEIMQGKSVEDGVIIDPKGLSTRAQVAAFLVRYARTVWSNEEGGDV